MGRGSGGAGDAGGALVEGHVPADKVDEGLVVLVGDRVLLAPDDVRAGAAVESAVAELAEQGQEPAVPGEGGGVVVGVEPADVRLEGLPGAEEVGVGAADDLAEAGAGGEPVVGVAGAGEAGGVADEPFDEIGGQQAAFGGDGGELGGGGHGQPGRRR